MTHDTRSTQILIKLDECSYSYMRSKKQCVTRLLKIRQWPNGSSCFWILDVRLHFAGINKLKSAKQAKQGDITELVISDSWLTKCSNSTEVRWAYLWVVKKTDNFSSLLLPSRHWLHRSSFTWTHNIRLNITHSMNKRVLKKSGKEHNKST